MIVECFFAFNETCRIVPKLPISTIPDTTPFDLSRPLRYDDTLKMSRCFLRSITRAVALLLALAVVPFVRGGDAPGAGGTNSPVFNKESLKSLDLTLRKPYNAFNEGSLDAVHIPTYYRPERPLTRQQQEKLQNNKDWAFLGDEDYDTGSKSKESSKLDDLDEGIFGKKKGSPMERFYERQDRSRNSAMTNRAPERASEDSTGDLPSRSGRGEHIFSAPTNGSSATLAAQSGDPEVMFRKLASKSYDASALKGSSLSRSLSDFFSGGGSGDAEAQRGMATRLTEFKKLLDSRSMGSGAFNNGGGDLAAPSSFGGFSGGQLAPTAPLFGGSFAGGGNAGSVTPTFTAPVGVQGLGGGLSGFTPAYTPPRPVQQPLFLQPVFAPPPRRF